MAKSKKNKAKKQTAQVAQQSLASNEEIVSSQAETEQPVASAEQAKASNVKNDTPAQDAKKGNDKNQKKDDKNKAKKSKEHKPNKVKETVAELKKVTWPTFGKVVKNTLLVLGIVLVFTLVLFAIDFGFGQLYTLLTPAQETSAVISQEMALWTIL